ncbi:MAG: hypothetical protein FJW40_16265 [Acidobacteria bacterium]|nr:hypothetical protein [Acidobacteriota bacterium]
MDGTSLKRLTTRAGHDFCPAWHPKGDRLAVVSEGPGGQWIRVVALDGREMATVARGFFRSTEPAWSPDGRWIAFAGIQQQGQSYQIYVTPAPYH